MDEIISRKSEDALSQNLGRSHALICQGSFSQARELLHDILDKGSKNGTAYMLLGYCAIAEGKHGEAVEWYRKGLEKEPGNSALLVLLGEALFMDQKHQEAKEILIGVIKQRRSAINVKLARALIEAAHLGVYENEFGSQNYENRQNE